MASPLSGANRRISPVSMIRGGSFGSIFWPGRDIFRLGHDIDAFWATILATAGVYDGPKRDRERSSTRNINVRTRQTRSMSVITKAMRIGGLSAVGAVLALGLFPRSGYAQNFVNGNFATGDFTGWTLSGNDSAFVSVNPNPFDPVGTPASDPVLPGESNFAAEMGPTGALGYLSQNLNLTPGTEYNLTYYLADFNGGTPAEFQVLINNAVVTDFVDPESFFGSLLIPDPSIPGVDEDFFTFDQFGYNFIAPSATDNIEFGFRQDVDFLQFGYANVEPGSGPLGFVEPDAGGPAEFIEGPVVSAAPEPSSVAMLTVGCAALGGVLLKRRRRSTGIVCPA
jgi:hypothetical protein